MRTVGSAVGPASGLDAFRELERFLSEAGEAHLGLSELERGAERRGRELLRLSLQAHLDSRGDGDVGEALVLTEQGGEIRLTHKRQHTRSLITIFGCVQLARVAYSARGRASIHPLDEELQLPGRSYSYELARRLCKGAVLGPFEEAVALIEELCGVKVPKRSAQQIVLESAVDFDAFYQQRADLGAPEPGEILVAAVDCKGIPMVKPDGATKVVRRGKGEKANKKKMATVAAVHSQRPHVRTPREVLDSLFCTERVPRPPRQPRPRPSHKRVWASCWPARTTSSPTSRPR